MKQGKNELASDITTEDSTLRDQLDIISQMEFLVKSGAVKHLIVAASLTAAKGNEITVMTDDITMYDYHALIGTCNRMSRCACWRWKCSRTSRSL